MEIKRIVWVFVGVLMAGMLLLPQITLGQAANKGYRIKISDNRNLQFNSYEYLFKGDSLKIFGVSDNGKSKVNYLSRKLKKKERKSIIKFLAQYPADSLQAEYFDDFVSFGYISSDHFPRVVELEIRKGLTQYKSKATNAWVKRYGELFDFLNTFISSQEVKLKFLESDFKKSF